MILARVRKVVKSPHYSQSFVYKGMGGYVEYDSGRRTALALDVAGYKEHDLKVVGAVVDTMQSGVGLLEKSYIACEGHE